MRSSPLPTVRRWSLAWLPVLLLAVPFSGCLGDAPRTPGALLRTSASGLFPFEEIDRGAPGVEAVDSCASLLDLLRDRALQQARVSLDQSVQQEPHQWAGIDFMADTPSRGFTLEATSADSAGAGAAHSVQGAQVTGTNNQETAADEADLVKTDGEWTYVLASGTLHVLRSRTIGDLEKVASVELTPDAWWSGGELLLERRDPADPEDDRLVAILPGQSPHAAEARTFLGEEDAQRVAYSMTRIVVLSLADRKAPAVEHETWVEGSPSGGRLVDGVAYVVVQRYEQMLPLRTWVGPEEGDLERLGLRHDLYERMDDDGRLSIRRLVALSHDAENQRLLAETSLEGQLPLVLRSQFGFILPQPVSDETCRSVLSSPTATGRAFSTILAIDVADAALRSTTTQVVGGSSLVYADAGTLVLAAPSNDLWWFWAQPQLEEATDLLWFDLDGLDVVQRAAGRVPGTILDSFSIDVHDGRLRVATTLGTWGRWWAAEPVPMSSQLMVLQDVAGILVPLGEVGGIAPGERIWSARFTDDRAYLVTFRQTDPLWVIDLAGTVPRILGELEVPGVSTYIHPLSDDLLLTIGHGPDASGQNLDWGNIQVSLFDIRDVAHPKRADVLDLSPPGGWTWSGATNEHRAFTYWSAIGTLAVPLTTSRGYEWQTSGGSEWRQETHLGLSLVTVDQEKRELRLRGEVDQDDLVPRDNAWWSPAIERSWFLGFPEQGLVSVYSMSMLGVTSNDLGTLERQDQVAFPHPDGYGYR